MAHPTVPVPRAPRPPDDDARLAMLRTYEVLDTDPEQQYDDLVRLAAAICGTPKAAISLIDEDRQWFKARLGIAAAQTSRETSFCAHTILQPDRLLEVPDATLDERFASNPLVTTEAGIRFYAGAPLVTEDDQALGALCVIDTRPRELTDEQREALAALSRQVVAQLELRRKLLDVARSEQRVRRSEARFRHLSEHDALTGLTNRAAFHGRLAQLCGTSVGLCFVDLDRFKEVNDEHGHEAGDTVLRHVASALVEACVDGAEAARLGGDEFVVLWPGADETALQRLAARVERAVERPVEVAPGVSVTVGASVGWSVADGTCTPDEALVRADRAMYDAKAARRRHALAAGTAGGLAGDLRRALERGEVEVHYQPFLQVRRDHGRTAVRVSGVEALARWTHPERGPVGPDEFVAVAERTGLVELLGAHVLRSACAQAADWEARGLLPDGFRVHVNVAAQQLHSPGMTGDVLAVLRTEQLAPERLCLEVTESGLLDVREFTVEAARSLVASGVSLALDDFGTGFSSLTQLRTYPFDVVKVDGSFVRGLGGSAEDEAIVEAVVTLARRLGIAPVAEGVETVEQLDRLLELGCSTVQGYLLGRPAVGPALEAQLAAGWRSLSRGTAAVPGPRRAVEEHAAVG